MRKLIIALVFFLLTLMSAVVFSANRLEPIQALYVFGDSLSDTGTVFRATGGLYPADPPYFQGRYSNGRVWVEYLAEQLSGAKLNNFAYGGATAAANRNSLVPAMLTQVQSFTRSQPQPDPNALYVLWAGANDYLQGATDTDQPVEAIRNAIAALSEIGAQRILVANLPDLGKLPATRSSANSEQLSRLTQSHNLALRRSLKRFGQEPSSQQIMLFDANLLYQEAIAHPGQFGLTQVMQSCLAGSRPCGDPGRFLFWDGIHPTTQAHRILADRAIVALETYYRESVP